MAVALVALLLPIGLPVGVATAEPPNETQCNGVDNGGGRAVECHVTVVNNLDQATGATSSTVTTVACSGAAATADTVFPNPQTNPQCTYDVTSYTALITAVTQCNGSGTEGATVRCSVSVTNNVTGSGTTSAATVNQCNTAGEGGGTEPTTACSPAAASTTSATVTQCNGSGNGGGGTEPGPGAGAPAVRRPGAERRQLAEIVAAVA